VLFSQPTTGQKVDARIEFGETVIRQPRSNAAAAEHSAAAVIRWR
jgi:hypothetical protein